MEEFRGRVGSRQLLRNTPANVSERSKKSRRSASEGGQPRAPSLGKQGRQTSLGSSREVRCACQYYMCDSLLPDKINPVGSQPSVKSRVTSPVNITRAATPTKNNLELHQNVNTELNLQSIEKDNTNIVRNASDHRNIHVEDTNLVKKFSGQNQNAHTEIDHKANEITITKETTRNASPMRKKLNQLNKHAEDSSGKNHSVQQNLHKDFDDKRDATPTNKYSDQSNHQADETPGKNYSEQYNARKEFDYKRDKSASKSIRNASPINRNSAQLNTQDSGKNLLQNLHADFDHKIEKQAAMDAPMSRNTKLNVDSNLGKNLSVQQHVIHAEHEHKTNSKDSIRNTLMRKNSAQIPASSLKIQLERRRLSVPTALDHKATDQYLQDVSRNVTPVRRNSSIHHTHIDGSHLDKNRLEHVHPDNLERNRLKHGEDIDINAIEQSVAMEQELRNNKNSLKSGERVKIDSVIYAKPEIVTVDKPLEKKTPVRMMLAKANPFKSKRTPAKMG